MTNAFVIVEPSKLSPEGFHGDPRVSKYLDLSTIEDNNVLESSSIGGHERLSSASCSISSRSFSSESTSHYGASYVSSHCSQDSMANFVD
jgi:hypothetical protein